MARVMEHRGAGDPPGPGGTVLLVDDEPLVRGILGRVLGAAGYRVQWACDAAEALALVAHDRGELVAVVSDVSMPGMRGDELVDRLATLAPGLPVVLMTGASGEPPTTSAASIIKKPFDTDEMLAMVDRVAIRRLIH